VFAKRVCGTCFHLRQMNIFSKKKDGRSYLMVPMIPRTAAGMSAGSRSTFAFSELDIVLSASMYLSPSR